MERLIVFVVAVVVYLIYRTVRDGKRGPAGTTPNSYASKSYAFFEIFPDPNLPQVRSIHSKIRGVTKRNADRSDRQRIIRQGCHPGDALCLVREPDNPYDHNAIQVRRIVCSDVPDKPRMGEQLGYLSRELAEEFASRMDSDRFVLLARILNVTGREAGESIGVNIELSVYMSAPKAAHPQRKKRRPRKKAEASGAPSCVDASDGTI